MPNLGRGFATGCAREPLKLALPAVLYDAPLHGAVMAHGMTGPHYSCRPIDLRGGIGIGSLRPVARPQGHNVPGPRHAVVIFRPRRQRAERRSERTPVVRAQMVVVVRPPTEPVVTETFSGPLLSPLV